MIQSLLRLLRRNPIIAILFDPPSEPERRESGRPPSANDASSFHLIWDLPHRRPIVEVTATLEVREPPTADRLYFWALQASFNEGFRPVGGGHLGIQYHPAYPNKAAVNWGGYDASGAELSGSQSSLPSALGNPNTRNYAWNPGQSYRLRITRSPDRGWRGSITDVETGEETVVRDLWADGDQLTAPMVWSEVFADCDHPSVEVMWSELKAVDDRGRIVEPQGVRVNYQTFGEGGCSNTNSEPTPGGYLQRTHASRVTTQGSPLPPA